LVEFALVAPVFFLLLFGLFDMGQLVYAKAVLTGAVQEAARSSALETADTTKADERIRETLRVVAPGARVEPLRLSYYDYADLGRPEKWEDNDGDGHCNRAEKYWDENRNGRWDRDIGVATNGGAGDVVVYTVTAAYSPLFGLPLIPGGMADRTITASALRKNEPFADQREYGESAGSCS
jgi:hypothetical protein